MNGTTSAGTGGLSSGGPPPYPLSWPSHLRSRPRRAQPPRRRQPPRSSSDGTGGSTEPLRSGAAPCHRGVRRPRPPLPAPLPRGGSGGRAAPPPVTAAPGPSRSAAGRGDADARSGTYKAVSPGFAGLPVGDHHRLLDVPEDLEVLAQAGVGGVVGQAPDEDLGVSGVLLRRVHLPPGPARRAALCTHAWPPGRAGPGRRDPLPEPAPRFFSF